MTQVELEDVSFVLFVSLLHAFILGECFSKCIPSFFFYRNIIDLHDNLQSENLHCILGNYLRRRLGKKSGKGANTDNQQFPLFPYYFQSFQREFLPSEKKKKKKKKMLVTYIFYISHNIFNPFKPFQHNDTF